MSDEVSKTPWMDWLKKHQGNQEIAGSQHNPWIVGLFKHTSYKTNADETPWCAACACAALEETGYKSTRSAAAKSFDKYGTPSELVYGAIVTIKYKATGRRHVTFFYSESSDPQYIYCLGGNQGNALKVSKYRRDEVFAVRWPIKTRI